MPADEYAFSGGGGALRLKGAKVKKHKKKKDKGSDLERNLSTSGNSSSALEKRGRHDGENDGPTNTEAGQAADEEDSAPKVHKTEAERRLEEAKQKKLKELSESGRPELLKTHKERVEQLNTYLSKLSEHHDMPKIGPG
ncbi:DUF1754-domain-containing protein [Thozetella sp. PMI_491]|nr:DUF1754-domain-containing protein [Thozetella sp. PMI_491]